MALGNPLLQTMLPFPGRTHLKQSVNMEIFLATKHLGAYNFMPGGSLKLVNKLIKSYELSIEIIMIIAIISPGLYITQNIRLGFLFTLHIIEQQKPNMRNCPVPKNNP